MQTSGHIVLQRDSTPSLVRCTPLCQEAHVQFFSFIQRTRNSLSWSRRRPWRQASVEAWWWITPTAARQKSSSYVCLLEQQESSPKDWNQKLQIERFQTRSSFQDKDAGSKTWRGNQWRRDETGSLRRRRGGEDRDGRFEPIQNTPDVRGDLISSSYSCSCAFISFRMYHLAHKHHWNWRVLGLNFSTLELRCKRKTLLQPILFIISWGFVNLFLTNGGKISLSMFMLAGRHQVHGQTCTSHMSVSMYYLVTQCAQLTKPSMS